MWCKKRGRQPVRWRDKITSYMKTLGTIWKMTRSDGQKWERPLVRNKARSNKRNVSYCFSKSVYDLMEALFIYLSIRNKCHSSQSLFYQTENFLPHAKLPETRHYWLPIVSVGIVSDKATSHTIQKYMLCLMPVSWIFSNYTECYELLKLF